MNRRLVFSNIAGFDLAGIHDYVAQRNRDAADRLLDRIRQGCLSIAEVPFSGAAVGSAHPGLRFRVIGKYVVYYRIDGEKVWIQRVLHGARDADRLL